MGMLARCSKIFMAFMLMFFALGLTGLEAEGKGGTIITDMAGRKITIPDKIERIVALSSTLRFVVYLKAADKVAGIEAAEKKEISNAGRPYLAALRGKADKIPIIGEGGAGRLPDFEKLISVAPQVIFTASIDPAHADIIQQKTNIPVVAVSYGGVGLLEPDEVINSLNLMGRILKTENRANKIKDFINKTLKDLQRRTDKIPQNKKPSVYVGGVSYRGAHGITSTQAFYPPLQWVNALNVANALNKHGAVFIDREKLLVWDPDIIFIDINGFSLVGDDYKKEPMFYKKLEAIKNNRVYSTLPYNNYFTNIEIALSNAYFMGKVLYPDKFSDIDSAKKANEIISFFTGVPTYNEIKEQLKGFGNVTFGLEGLDVK